MNSEELDKALKNFEKKHPIKKTIKLQASLRNFVSDIEKQLDKLDHK